MWAHINIPSEGWGSIKLTSLASSRNSLRGSHGLFSVPHMPGREEHSGSCSSGGLLPWLEPPLSLLHFQFKYPCSVKGKQHLSIIGKIVLTCSLLNKSEEHSPGFHGLHFENHWLPRSRDWRNFFLNDVSYVAKVKTHVPNYSMQRASLPTVSGFTDVRYAAADFCPQNTSSSVSSLFGWQGNCRISLQKTHQRSEVSRI